MGGLFGVIDCVWLEARCIAPDTLIQSTLSNFTWTLMGHSACLEGFAIDLLNLPEESGSPGNLKGPQTMPETPS